MEENPRLTIYKASAGSGKTFTLAVEYIKLLLLGGRDEYEHTLAVTFTNKATAEMKDRILEQLYGLAHDLPSSRSYMQALSQKLADEGVEMGTEMIRQRCRQALTSILHGYSRFTVQTIDSFFQSVLKTLAHELNLTARLQVDLDQSELLGRAVDNMLDGMRPNSPLLASLRRYTRDRMDDAQTWDPRSDIKTFAANLTNEAYMLQQEHQDEPLTDERIDLYERQIREYSQQFRQAVDDALDAITQWRKDNQGRLDDKDISRLSNLMSALNKMRNDDFEYSPSATMQSYREGTDKLIVARAKEDPAKLEAASELAALLTDALDAWANHLYHAISAKEACKNLNPLRLLRAIDREVSLITQDTNHFMLAKTPILLSELVRQSDAPFVMEKMGVRYNNVMIDEFQDTSNMQWQNFRVLLLEGQAQGGRDLIVGDVKQSIYRWRNGDWRILQNMKQEMRTVEVEEQTLACNFRSEQRIIDFNNRFFTHAARIVDEVSGDNLLQTIYSDVSQQWRQGIGTHGCVRIAIENAKPDSKGKGKNNAEEAPIEEGEQRKWNDIMLDDLCEQVKVLNEVHHVPFRDMAILMRYRNKVDAIIARFAERLPHVRLISDEAFLLSGSTAVNMIVEAMRYLDSTNDDPVALRYLQLHYQTDVLGNEGMGVEALVDDPTEVLPAEYLDHKDELRMTPLYQLSEQLYHIFNLSRIPQQEAYLMAFYDQLNAYITEHATDLHSFIRYWDEKMCKTAIPSGQVDGIRILTIHKSKGLQFHTVLMPFVDWELTKEKGGKKSTTYWFTPEASPYDGLGVLPVKGCKLLSQSAFATPYNEEKYQKRIDELNALYVAFTRAEKNLLVWCKQNPNFTDKKGGISGTVATIVQNTMPEVMAHMDAEGCAFTLTPQTDFATYQSGEYEPYVAGTNHSSDNRLCPDREPMPISVNAYQAKLDFRQSNDSARFLSLMSAEMPDTIDNQLVVPPSLSKADQGTILHEIFSHIVTLDDSERVVDQYRHDGSIDQTLRDRIQTIVGIALSRPDVKTWFDGTYRIFSECEVLTVDPDTGLCQHRRPDRVMMSDTEIIVVDFKFGGYNPKYEPQVRAYMDLMQHMYPNHTVRGYLWYVSRNEIQAL